MALLAAWWRGWGAAGIFFLAAALYFVTYEGLHALYHLPDRPCGGSGLGGRCSTRMRSHHRHHHRLDRMSHVNFNVTFPLMDWVLGTKEKETAPPVPVTVAPAEEPGQQAQA